MKSDEKIERPLKALRSAGTVFGVVFYKGIDIVFNETPFSGERALDLGTTLDDINFYFTNEGRDIDQLSFGFDGGNMLIVSDQDYRVVVLHSLMDEVDIIAKAARAFLIDYQMGIFASELNQNGSDVAEAIASGEEPQAMKPVVAAQTIDLAEVEGAEDAPDRIAATGPIQPIVERTQPIPAAQNPSTREPVPQQAETTEPEAATAAPAAAGDAANRAVLSTKQPENTLPPPRKPKIRR